MVSNVPRLAYVLEITHLIRLGTIPFKIISLCSHTVLPAPLPVLFSKRVKFLLQFALDLRHGVKTATHHLQFDRRQEEEVARGQIWRVWPRKHVLQELGEMVHCHEASNCPRASVQAFSAECPPSDAPDHCSRTCRWRSGPRGRIHGEQPRDCRKKRRACSWSRCGRVSPSSVVEMLVSFTANTVGWSRPQW